MKRFVQTWGKCIGVVSLLVLVLAVFVWRTSRPVTLHAEELTRAVERETYPGTQLKLDITAYQMTMTVENHSDITLESGAAVDQNKEIFEIPWLEVLLDGVWYSVPHETYASAGVGLELAPGEAVSMRVVLSPYGKLPDGQYRISFGYWPLDPGEDRLPAQERPFYAVYARFDMEKGRYTPSW
ncbi:MAG: hypothetical protein HFF50_00825 [Lawsonibacter sp.]|nr:hypothetical protein [Lawsonibacter sp.]